MSPCRLVFPALLVGILIAPSPAQNPPVPPMRDGGVRSPQRNRPRQEPCWQVAGIPKSAISQRRAIAQQTRQEVEAVCANSSLSMRQKRTQIREVRQKERQQIEAVITPPQQQALEACRKERGLGGHARGGHGAGPCGEMPQPKETKPESDRED